MRKNFVVGGRALEHAAQGGCGVMSPHWRHKIHLDALLCNLLWVTLCLGRGVGLEDLQRPLPTLTIL